MLVMVQNIPRNDDACRAVIFPRKRENVLKITSPTLEWIQTNALHFHLFSCVNDATK